MGKFSRNKAVKEFDVRDVVKKYLATYIKVI